MFLLRPLKGDIAQCGGQDLDNAFKANMTANFMLKNAISSINYK